MSDFTLNIVDAAALVVTYGRGVVFYAPKWDAETPLTLTQLGITEGDIVINSNAATAGLTIPELTGPAVHEMDYLGESPTVEIPMYLADPALIAIVSPSGSASAGRSRRGVVQEYTLWIVPEGLFIDPNADADTHTVSFDGAGVWTVDDVAITDDQQRFLDASFWMWRAVFNRPTRRFRGGAGDDKKNLETVTATAMHHPGLPDGHHIYSSGDPFAFDIDLNGMS